MAEWGFDEGGVLEALNKPMVSRTTTTYKYKKIYGSDPPEQQIVSETVTVFSISMADVLAAGIIMGLIVVGEEVYDEILNSPELTLGIFGVSGLIAATLIKAGKESDASSGAIGAFLEGIFSFKI